MQSVDEVELRARGCLCVVLFVAVALPIFDCDDRSSDRADCRHSGLFLRVALDASKVEVLRPLDDLGASVVNAARSGIERQSGAACRFEGRRACRGVSGHHRKHYSVESHGGMSLLDCVSALKAPYESQSRADIVCRRGFCCSYFMLFWFASRLVKLASCPAKRKQEEESRAATALSEKSLF